MIAILFSILIMIFDSPCYSSTGVGIFQCMFWLLKQPSFASEFGLKFEPCAKPLSRPGHSTVDDKTLMLIGFRDYARLRFRDLRLI